MGIRRIVFAAGGTFVVGAVLWLVMPRDIAGVIREVVRPTTAIVMPISGCAPIRDVPPGDWVRIVDDQRCFYHLELQGVVGCRVPYSVRDGNPEHLFGEETRKRWRPLYAGRGTYQFDRHFVVVVSETDERGSIVVEGVMVQKRMRYLRSRLR